MSLTRAQYLLRIDDLCPTHSREGWKKLRTLIDEFQVKPILAVVPENLDPELMLSSPDASFWDEMAALESAGAMIGLHGFHHLCAIRGPCLVGIHRTSEFAGVSIATQQKWIRSGICILRDHGLNPRIFVAPRHGFDAWTLRALRTEGISLITDGFARQPHMRAGITWIPQQLWGPVKKPSGLWTICIHPNHTTDSEIARLRAFLHANSNRFTSVDRLIAASPATPLTLVERIQAEVALRRFKLSHAVNGIRRLTLSRSSRSA